MPSIANKDPFDVWYSTHGIAARFFTGLSVTVAERTIRREIERQPALRAAAVRKFGQLFLPWRVLGPWLQASEPAKVMPGKRPFRAPPGPAPQDLSALHPPIFARSEGELTRKLVQAFGQGGVEHG